MSVNHSIGSNPPHNSKASNPDSLDSSSGARAFKNIVNTHPDLICTWLPDGTLTFANKAYCQYFGKSLSDLVGKTCLDYIHPDDQARLADHIKNFENGGQQATIELRIFDTEGQIRWHQWIDKFTVNPETGVGEFLSTGRDITELKEAERENERRMAFEHMITKLSIDFIKLSLDDIDAHIHNLLGTIGQFTDVDRSYVFQFSDDGQLMSNTHEWCADGVQPFIENLQDIECKAYPWWVQKVKNQETILINDPKDLPPEAENLRKTFEKEKIKSGVSIPLVNAGVLLGFIGFDSVKAHRNWTAEDENILQIVGGIVGSAIVQKRNQIDLSRQKRYLEQLNEISLVSLNARNIDDLVGLVAMKMLTLINADNCSINLWDEDNKEIITSAYNGVLAYKGKELFAKSDEATVTEHILSTGEMVVIEDVSKSQLTSKRLSNLFTTKSLMAMPLVADRRILGTVIFGFANEHTFTDEELALSKQAASQIGQAILKQHLLEEAQHSAYEADMLHRAGTIVASTLDPNIAIDSILDQLEQVVPFKSASVQILVDDELEIKAGKGWPADMNPVGFRFPIPGENPNSQVVETGKPYVLNDAPELYNIFKEPVHMNIRSWLGVPLTVRDTVTGILTLDHEEPNFYDNPRLVDLVTAFADQVAIALENARLYANERQRVIELDALRATTADITKELGVEKLIRSILHRATELMNATGGELGLVAEDGESIRILVSHKMHSDTAGRVIDFNDGLMGAVAKTRQIQTVEDYKSWSGQMESYKDSKIHAAIAAPLVIGNRFLGVIGVMNSDRKRKFTESEKNLMKLFAQQAAIAVENAKLFEEKQQQARMDITTGLYNRRGLYELGDREVDRAIRYERPLAVVFADLDYFKRVNDRYGHYVGDLVLTELAERLRENLRSIDVLGRYGGEEFVYVLPETDTESAMEVCERIRQIVEGSPFTPNDLSINITISQGVAILDEIKQDLDMLIKSADIAAYQSKDTGRNKTTLFKNESPSSKTIPYSKTT
ncbi:GAF domain-containing protein [bacterium]|nr:GAF domain-containing protein [bacterium]